MTTLSRRDFLRLAGFTPVYYSLARNVNRIQTQQKNVLILVYDAWTASNISLYGYDRETTPHLADLASKAVTYQQHNAGSDFTSPGTASILTGTLPWTHRAINYAGTILPQRAEHNLFHAMDTHHSVAYSHNVLANEILQQLVPDIEQYIPRHELLLVADWVEQIFTGDFDTSTVSRYYVYDKENPLRNSLLLSDVVQKLADWINEVKLREVRDQFPKGIPEGSSSSSYTLEGSHQWLIDHLPSFPRPFLGYFHFLPPHAPYTPRIDFVDRFDDNFRAVDKPQHFFTSQASPRDIPIWRQEYDEFIAYVDAEIGRLFQTFEQQGVLENTVVLLTSDHGELFERGLVLHGKNVFYESIMHVPLMIFDPDLPSGTNITAPTSAIDLLPTIMHLTGKPVPDWAEGRILPPYGPTIEPNRSIYSLAAIDSQPNKPLDIGTYALRKPPYKLTYYEGYAELPHDPYIELYDVENDPDELVNLANEKPGIRDAMLDELLAQKRAADEPFTQSG